MIKEEIHLKFLKEHPEFIYIPKYYDKKEKVKPGHCPVCEMRLSSQNHLKNPCNLDN